MDIFGIRFNSGDVLYRLCVLRYENFWTKLLYVVYNKIQSLALAQSTDGHFKSPQANILNLNFLKYIVFVWLTKTPQCDKDFFVSILLHVYKVYVGGNLKYTYQT